VKRAVIVPLLTVALGLTACSGEAKPKTTPSSATLAPVAQLAPVTLPEDPGPLVDTIAKQVKAAGSVHAEISTGDDAGSADMRTDTALPTMNVEIRDTSITHAVVLDGVIYARTDGSEVESGKPWARLARQDIPTGSDEVTKMLTSLLNEVEQALNQVSADTGLAMVRDGAFAKPATTENLDGVSVHRYEGSTSGQKLDKALEKAGLTGVSWTLWVGDDGLPRKFSATLKGAVSTVSYSKWGSPVTVVAPPANQVASLT
jgi:hypothetical protein